MGSAADMFDDSPIPAPPPSRIATPRVRPPPIIYMTPKTPTPQPQHSMAQQVPIQGPQFAYPPARAYDLFYQSPEAHCVPQSTDLNPPPYAGRRNEVVQRQPVPQMSSYHPPPLVRTPVNAEPCSARKVIRKKPSLYKLQRKMNDNEKQGDDMPKEGKSLRRSSSQGSLRSVSRSQSRIIQNGAVPPVPAIPASYMTPRHVSQG